MQYAYLDVFVDKLEKLFSAIFNDVFGPILTDILRIFVNFFINVVWNLLSELLIGILIALCSIIDFFQSIFEVFSGTSPVMVSDKTMGLLDAVFQLDAVSRIFTYITVMSVAICFIFTIYKTVKSISDMAFEDKNPISKVLASGMKAAVTFVMIPFLCVFLLQLSSAITQQVQETFTMKLNGEGTIGTIVFLSASMDADKNTMEKKNLNNGEMKVKDKTRCPSFTGEGEVRSKYMEDPKLYKNLKTVREDFYVENFNYVIGLTMGVLVFLIMAGAVLSFVRRLFELLLLYIVSPLYVSTIPLDDGVIFARWRELFVAKFFSGFGTVFAMKYYLMIVPAMVSSNMEFYNSSLPNGAMINNVLRIFLVVGGAWAVYKSQSLIMVILAPEAAMTEQQSGSLMTGLVVGGASKAAATVGRGTVAAAQKGSAAVRKKVTSHASMQVYRKGAGEKGADKRDKGPGGGGGGADGEGGGGSGDLAAPD